MTTDDESILPPADFSIPEVEEKKTRRKTPKLRKKLPPFGDGEHERLVSEYFARGGKATVYPMAGEMHANLRMRGKNVANRSLVEIAESAASIKREERDFLG